MTIRIDHRFNGGNAAVVQITPPPDAEVVFTPAPQGGPEALWFDFCLKDTEPPDNPPESLTISLRFFGNLLGAGDPSVFRPVFRQESKNWNRLRAPSMRALPDGQSLLSWSIPYPLTRTEIAFCFPYGQEELQGLLQRSKGYWREEAIGLTQTGRFLTRLDNHIGSATGTRPRGLYLVARQHSGETPGSWVMDGMLEGFSRRRPGNQWCVWAIPFADLDGVIGGNYGKDAFPYDLNRAWGEPAMRHETLVMQRDMQLWAQRCRPELVLDLHAPGACETDGLYLFHEPPAESENDRDAQAWIHLWQQELKEFAAPDFARIAVHASRWNTPRITDFARTSFRCTAFSMEIPYALCGDIPMTPKQYREAGRRLARAILARW